MVEATRSPEIVAFAFSPYCVAAVLGPFFVQPQVLHDRTLDSRTTSSSGGNSFELMLARPGVLASPVKESDRGCRATVGRMAYATGLSCYTPSLQSCPYGLRSLAG